MKLRAIGLALTLASTAALAADVGVSVTIGQPGFYGHIDIGNVRQAPAVIYAEPMIIRRGGPVLAPIYLRVPPGHEKHWDRHCRDYDACGRPVYFVREDWYQRQYSEPEGRRGRDDDGDRGDRRHGRENGRGHGKGHGRD